MCVKRESVAINDAVAINESVAINDAVAIRDAIRDHLRGSDPDRE